MYSFTELGWLVAGFSAILIGLSKTGLPGAGILAPALVATILPARLSTGFLLPLLIAGDILAILYWRRHVVWRNLARPLPWTLCGVLIGYMGLSHITDRQLLPFIGITVLSLLGLSWWKNSRTGEGWAIPTTWWFAGIAGTLAGATSMMANAAGPIVVVYMLALKMEKKNLIGTTAWFFWILNLSKVPFSGSLNLISTKSLLTDLVLLPCILAGGMIGIFLAHRLPQRLFNRILEVLAAGAALYLCIKPFL